jgi:hypothetical protein
LLNERGEVKIGKIHAIIKLIKWSNAIFSRFWCLRSIAKFNERSVWNRRHSFVVCISFFGNV